MSTNPNIKAQQAKEEGEDCYGHAAINIINTTEADEATKLEYFASNT